MIGNESVGHFVNSKIDTFLVKSEKLIDEQFITISFAFVVNY